MPFSIKRYYIEQNRANIETKQSEKACANLTRLEVDFFDRSIYLRYVIGYAMLIFLY